VTATGSSPKPACRLRHASYVPIRVVEFRRSVYRIKNAIQRSDGWSACMAQFDLYISIDGADFIVEPEISIYLKFIAL
jgi:hypothetical protein